MVAAVSGRLVTYKQKSLSMFHPGVLVLVQTAADMIPNLIMIALFSLILYEAAGLAQTAGQFFAFLLFLFSGCLCLTAMFRLIGNASPNLDIGHTVSGVILLFSILLNGYLKPPGQTGWWFRWIYWEINPLAYAYKTLMANEFRNLELTCTGASLMPSGPGFDNIAHQVCTLQGARSGELNVLGRDYIAFVEFGNTGYTIRVHKRRKPKVTLVAEDQVAASKETLTFSESLTDEQILAGTTFIWKDLNYTVPVKG
ncbi:ATP-binding cassette transporter snq2 [Coemansia sp. RSA 2131]|nr:ATP-binding cassette transporter snq2 [Coemansia sp. RSA 2131]